MINTPASLRTAIIVFAAVVFTHGRAFAGPTLDKIKSTHTFACGINTEQNEYTIKDAHGNRAAFDADICKAVAVAVLGPNAVYKAVAYPDEEESLKALKSGEVAMVATATPALRNNQATGLGFSPIVLYDYQALMVNKSMNIKSAKDLAGKETCFVVGSPMQDHIAAYMEREAIKWIPGPFSEEGEMEAALITRNCAAVTADVTQLAFERIAFKGLSANFEILPEVIAKDPLAAAYRLDDPQWAAIVDWSIEALIQAEESGISQKNLAASQKSSDMVTQRLLGTQRGWGTFLGLDDAWAYRIIEAVGNYGELFDRNLGTQSPMKIDRGPNKLWNEGGLLYALPLR